MRTGDGTAVYLRVRFSEMAAIFVGKIPELCICPYCENLLDAPVGFRECEHAYCARCARKVVASESRCRVCAKLVTAQSVVACKSGAFNVPS